MVAQDSSWVGIEASGALTALGDERATCAGLVEGAIAWQRLAIPGVEASAAVPLALACAWGESVPPRGWLELDALLARVPDAPWGAPGYPVVISSSNFGVGNLWSWRREQERAEHLPFGTPYACAQRLCERQGWGADFTVVSHACVSAHLALELARRQVAAGRAVKALVVSFDFVSAFVAGGFHALKILNGLAPEPYRDRTEGSIAIGDGAAFAVLGSGGEQRISPAHLHNEMWHATGNRPDGEGFGRLGPWLAEHGCGRSLWVKGHGTGTLESGRMEAELAARLVPAGPLVSWKGSLGHTLGSCGLVELAIVRAGLAGGRMPGNVGSPPPHVGATVQADAFDPSPYSATLMLANAFGGAHASFLLSHGH